MDIRVGDLAHAAEDLSEVAGRVHVVTANPPYIASAVIPTLSAEVRREPVLALDGGADGLQFYDRICAAVREHLEPGGALVVEHGFDQAEAVRMRFEAAGMTGITLVHDLGKNPRVTWAIAPGGLG